MERFQILYDGECPLCRREIGWIKTRSKEVEFVDISAKTFSAGDFNLTQEQVMSEIHAILGQRVITGMEVFRELYSRAGLGWILAPTRFWPLRPIFDKLYRLFARNRLKLTGRCEITLSK